MSREHAEVKKKKKMPFWPLNLLHGLTQIVKPVKQVTQLNQYTDKTENQLKSRNHIMLVKYAYIYIYIYIIIFIIIYIIIVEMVKWLRPVKQVK